MRKERKIININIRLNLCDEQDRQAWEYLQTMDREKYKSYTRAVVVLSLIHIYERKVQKQGSCIRNKTSKEFGQFL